VSATTSASDVIGVFKTIGVVSRVDFAPLGKKPGFKENVYADVKTAFVHVVELFTHGTEIVSMIKSGRSYKIFPYETSDEYWTFAEAKTPIQDTMMNNAQIVQNCRYLEKKVEHQAVQLEEQAADIRALTEKLNGVHHAVYQLLGGLYCQKNQSRTLNDMLEYLFPENSRSRFEEPDDSKWDMWPTTRQGDDCERRIEELEQDLDAAIDAINQHAGRGKVQDEKIRQLEQQVTELTFEPTFTPYGECQYEEDQEGEDEEDQEHTRSFVPVPMEHMIYQRQFDYIDNLSNATHSSVTEVTQDDDDDATHSSVTEVTQDDDEDATHSSVTEVTQDDDDAATHSSVTEVTQDDDDEVEDEISNVTPSSLPDLVSISDDEN
jgi:hypothetical protein